MRRILPTLLATLTGHSRQLVEIGRDFNWTDGNSRVWQLFRLYEVIFGRRAGIRFEGTCQDGVCIFGTWENFLAHQEGRLRTLKNPFAFKFVPLPILVTPDGTRFAHNSIFNFAIAYDTSADPGQQAVAGTYTTSVTVTGSNPLLFAWGAGGTTGASTITSTTYNAVSMTAVKNVLVPGDRWWDCYMAVGPATGAHNLVMTDSTGTMYFLGSASYSGCAQTGQPDASNNATISGGPAGTVFSGTVTVVGSNCWIIYMASLRGSLSTANSPGSSRKNTADFNIADSNATVSTGSNTCSYTSNFTGSSGGMVMVSFSAVSSTAVVHSLMLMGMGS